MARGAVAVALPVAVTVGMAVAVALVVAPKLVMPALAIVSERAPVLAAMGEIPAHLVVGLAGMAAPVVPSIGGGRT